MVSGSTLETQQQLDPPEKSVPESGTEWMTLEILKDLVFLLFSVRAEALVISGSVLKPIRCKDQSEIINYAELGEIKEDSRVEEKGKKRS